MTRQKAKAQTYLREPGAWPRRLREPLYVRIVAPTLESRAQCKLPTLLPVSRETRFGAAARCRAASLLPTWDPCGWLVLGRKELKPPHPGRRIREMIDSPCLASFVPRMFVKCVHDAVHSDSSLIADNEAQQLTHFTAVNNILFLVCVS